MKKIHFLSKRADRGSAIPQPIALGILKALHRYIETGRGGVKRMSGEFKGLLRLRVGAPHSRPQTRLSIERK